MRYTRSVRSVLGVVVVAASSIGLGAGSASSAGRIQGVAAVTTPGTIVVECFGIDRGPDPKAVVRTLTKNFGFDTLVVRKAERMCEPALKLPENTDPAGGTVEMQPNATLTLSADAGGIIVVLDGALGLLRESPTLPSKGKVVAAMMQGGAELPDGFFDVFTELAAIGSYEQDSFFDITYRVEGGAGPSQTTEMRLASQGGGIYMGHLDPAIVLNGTTLTDATLTLNDPADPKGPRATRVLECFRTEKGSDPNDPYALVTKNFGTDKVVVRQSQHLCEGALKTREPIQPGTPLTLKPPDLVWECWAIQEGDNVARNFIITTQNFGTHKARVQRAFQLCEDAEKHRINAAGVETVVGHATGRVWECYTLTTRPTVNGGIFWLTTKNFGSDPNRVRNAVAMCEMARKIPLNGFPGDPNG